MGVIGAILGDISGSQYEFHRTYNPEHCLLFSDHCRFTDDTAMTLAVKYAIDTGTDYDTAMHLIGDKYPDAGYGDNFFEWIYSDKHEPYGSWGNGAAMRVSYIGEHFEDLEEVKREAEKSAAVSHNHPEGIKGAVVTAVCVWMARHEKSKEEIHDYVAASYPADEYRWHIDVSMQDLYDNYRFDISCQGSVPIAMKFALESSSFSEFLRKIYSIECDADTLAAIGGGVAEELYGTGLDDDDVIDYYLPKHLKGILYGKEE